MSLVDIDESGSAAPSAAGRRWQRLLFVGWVALLVAQVYLAWTAGEVRSIATAGAVSLWLSGVVAAAEGQLVAGHRARRPLLAASTLLLVLSFVGLLTALARRSGQVPNLV